MTVPPIGWVLIPLGIVLAISSPSALFILTIFVIPFSATAVINVGTGELASGVQAWMFLGSLLVVRRLLRLCMELSWRIPLPSLASVRTLLLFLAVCIASLAMPAWINGHLQVTSPILLDSDTKPLFLSTGNLTAVMYLIYGASFCFLIVERTQSREGFRSALRAYIGGAVFASAWGLFQFACPMLGLTYPAAIFNSSATPSAAGYKAGFTGIDVTRISSVAVEPSILAEVLITTLPFFLPALSGRGAIFTPKIDKICAVLIGATLLLTTSTSAYAGVLMTLVIVGWCLVRWRRISFKWVLLTAGLATILCIWYAATATVQQVFAEAVLNKGGSYSALERLKTVGFAFGYFRQYPWLGIGWGSATSHDLVVKVLSNSGILGLLSFALFVGVTFKQLRANLIKRSRHLANLDTFRIPSFLLMISFGLMLLLNLISGFSVVFGHFWFVTGLALACVSSSFEFRPAGIKAK